jgi:superfamily I DNA/RNA helicase
VLTHRIAYLIHTGEARADELLAITFTNKAAQEMRERVELLLGRSTRGMWVMTFHAACTRMLRVEAPRLGYTRQFTIYDQADARRLLKQLPGRGRGRPQALPAGRGARQISDAKNRLRDAAEYRSMVGSYFEQTVADAYELYERELLRFNAMDFDDLLVRASTCSSCSPRSASATRRRFRHVLVDEYQDTNHAQYRWLTLLGRRAAQPRRRRRRRAVDLRLPRRRHPQHPRLRRGLPGRPHRQARAELPLDADDPVGRQRRDRATTAARSRRTSGPSSGRATRSRCGCSPTSTPRRATC